MPAMRMTHGSPVALAVLAGLLAAGCEEPPGANAKQPAAPEPAPFEKRVADRLEALAAPPATLPAGYNERLSERRALVRSITAGTGADPLAISDEHVIRAMLETPRHRFVPPEEQAAAYEDRPLSIGHGQTISQPYIVAFMTQAARIRPGAIVLEVGTGSGYGAAVLARIAAEVYTIEIIPELAQSASERLETIGFDNVHVRAGDGYRGWPDKAPFDAIVVTAAPEHVPQPLIQQLAVGGRLVIPVGPEGGVQQLKVITKTAEGVVTEDVLPVRFVPMTGEAQAAH